MHSQDDESEILCTTLDASVIPFPVSAHLVRFRPVVRFKYRCSNGHFIRCPPFTWSQNE